MPYIVQSERDNLDPAIDALIDKLQQGGPREGGWSAGQLNYVFTKIIITYFKRYRSYAVINDILGVLSAVGHEFYRRQAAAYEDSKIMNNGDVK